MNSAMVTTDLPAQRRHRLDDHDVSLSSATTNNPVVLCTGVVVPKPLPRPPSISPIVKQVGFYMKVLGFLVGIVTQSADMGCHLLFLLWTAESEEHELTVGWMVGGIYGWSLVMTTLAWTIVRLVRTIVTELLLEKFGATAAVKVEETMDRLEKNCLLWMFAGILLAFGVANVLIHPSRQSYVYASLTLFLVLGLLLKSVIQCRRHGKVGNDDDEADASEVIVEDRSTGLIAV